MFLKDGMIMEEMIGRNARSALSENAGKNEGIDNIEENERKENKGK